MKKIAKNSLLLLISFMAAVIIAELLVRALVPIRNVGPSFSIYDSVYGMTLKRSLTATRTTPEFTMELSTNSLGFRGPEPQQFPNNSLLFLGDSFTMGYGVSDGEEFPDLIRQALIEKWEADAPLVINAGIGNRGNGHWIKFLRSEATEYEPQLVVIQLFANDFQDNINERLFALSPQSELIELPVPAKSRQRALQELIEAVPGLASSYLVGLARQVVSSARQRQSRPTSETTPAPDPSSNRDQLTYRLIEEVIRLCEMEDWPMIALVVGIEGERFDQVERRLTDGGISFVRFPNKSERPDLYYEVDGHWNAQGHALAAELLLKVLAQREFR